MPAVEVDASAAVAHFSSVVRRAGDLRPLFRLIVDDFHSRQRQVFDTAGASQGTPWRPLRPAHLRWRMQTGRGSQPLRYSTSGGGRLFRSLTQRGAAGQVLDERSDELRIGTRIPIAAELHSGTSRDAVIPARPLVSIDRKTSDRWLGLIGTYLTEED